eukprot:3766522-Rhodomonas_salina.1
MQELRRVMDAPGRTPILDCRRKPCTLLRIPLGPDPIPFFRHAFPLPSSPHSAKSTRGELAFLLDQIALAPRHVTPARALSEPDPTSPPRDASLASSSGDGG